MQIEQLESPDLGAFIDGLNVAILMLGPNLVTFEIPVAPNHSELSERLFVN